MASNSYQTLSTLFFSIFILNFAGTALSDTPCPYPCYPLPIGGSGTPTTAQPPPADMTPPSQSGGSSYPPPTGYYPSPYGNLPNYPSPPYGGGGNNFYGPPPPDPILPYFPFYYRRNPHKTDESTSAAKVVGTSSFRILAVANLVILVLLGASFTT